MNDVPRQKLVELVRRQGKSIVDDARRAEGFFRDYFGGHRREISVLTAALEEGVGADLLAAAAGQTPRAVLLSRLARRLTDNRGLSDEAANWAVNSWALALGVVSNDDLRTIEPQIAQTSSIVAAPEQASTVRAANAANAVQPKMPSVQKASPKALVVAADGSGDFVSINEAIRAASDGAKISVRSGLYEESVVIDKQIEIVGDGAISKTILRSFDSNCISMQSPKAAVRNLTVQGAAASAGKKAFAIDIAAGELFLGNCDITSDSLACIAVRGRETNPIIRDCRIRDGADGGIYFFDSAAGSIEECEIYQNRSANVVIAQNANPTFKKCRVFAGENAGFWIYENGLGTIDDSEIFGHLHSEIVVTRSGSPVLRGCSIHNGNASGVFVRNGGHALLEDCRIFENADAGLSVDGASIVAASNCRINRNGKVAVRVKGGSTVRVENSDLRGNLLATWETDSGVFVENTNNLDG
jgi:hypothetical protein